MPAGFLLLNASPTGTINLGAAAGANLVKMALTVMNTGNSPLTVSNLLITPLNANLGDFGFIAVALPATIAPGTSVHVADLEFTGSKPDGTLETCTLTFTSNAISGMQVFTAEALWNSNVLVQLGYIFGFNNGSLIRGPSVGLGTLAVGQVVTFTVRMANSNLGSGSAIVGAVADAGDGFAVAPSSDTIAASGTFDFTVTFTVPSLSPGFVDIPAAVTFSTTGNTNSTCTFEVFYSIASIVPAYTLTGAQEATALGLYNTAGPVSLLDSFQPGMLVEDLVFWTRQYYIDQPHLNKNVNRIWLLYERVSSGQQLILTLDVVNPKNQTSPSDTINLDTATDGLLEIGVFDLQIIGSCIELAFSPGEFSAPLSIVGWLLKVDEIGEVIEGT